MDVYSTYTNINVTLEVLIVDWVLFVELNALPHNHTSSVADAPPATSCFPHDIHQVQLSDVVLGDHVPVCVSNPLLQFFVVPATVGVLLESSAQKHTCVEMDYTEDNQFAIH